MESEKSLFEPLFKLDTEFKPISLENNPNSKIIVSDELWTVDNVISREEAELLIECTEKVGYIDAQVGSEDGECKFVLRFTSKFFLVHTLKEIRDSRRVQITDKALAKYLFDRCINLVPRAFEGGLLLDMNERIRFLKYDRPGDHFFPHFDACVKRNESELSMVTFQIYLSEGLEGGETVFIENCFPDGRYACFPKTGKALFFRQKDWVHEGAPIISGIKYTLLTDFMYKWFTHAEAKTYIQEVKEIPKCGVCGKTSKFIKTNCEHAFLICNCVPHNSMHILDDEEEEKINKRQAYCTICDKQFEFPEDVLTVLQKKLSELKAKIKNA